jgi:hypothetical protein
VAAVYVTALCGYCAWLLSVTGAVRDSPLLQYLVRRDWKNVVELLSLAFVSCSPNTFIINSQKLFALLRLLCTRTWQFARASTDFFRNCDSNEDETRALLRLLCTRTSQFASASSCWIVVYKSIMISSDDAKLLDDEGKNNWKSVRLLRPLKSSHPSPQKFPQLFVTPSK